MEAPARAVVATARLGLLERGLRCECLTLEDCARMMDTAPHPERAGGWTR